LARPRALDFFCVIVEASLPDVLNGKFGQYGAGCNPLSIWETVAAFTIRYCPFLFVGNRVTGVRLVESLLTKWVREHFKILQAIEKATKKLNRPVAEAIPF
ncbi:MAG: hypothetical protein FJY85_13140, partial [Deltaproteobacteria bacterium]|nr:hypothetical protein [Deltaproteobacteria bacterium]